MVLWQKEGGSTHSHAHTLNWNVHRWIFDTTLAFLILLAAFLCAFFFPSLLIVCYSCIFRSFCVLLSRKKKPNKHFSVMADFLCAHYIEHYTVCVFVALLVVGFLLWVQSYFGWVNTATDASQPSWACERGFFFQVAFSCPSRQKIALWTDWIFVFHVGPH